MNVEIKLMDKGTDVIYARDTNLFLVVTSSEMNEKSIKGK